MKEVKKALYPNKTPSPPALKKEKATLLLYSSKDIPAMRTLIPCFLLLPMLAPLTWALILSLVVTLVSMVTHLMHLLLSSRDLAWLMTSIASIFGDPNPGMASISCTSLHHTTMPHFFDSSLYTGPGAQWNAPHDYFSSDDH
jgi:hypothetical protein